MQARCECATIMICFPPPVLSIVESPNLPISIHWKWVREDSLLLKMLQIRFP